MTSKKGTNLDFKRHCVDGTQESPGSKNNNNVVDFLAKIRFTTVQQLLFRCIQRQAN